jgi:hypothetical protein
MTIPELISQFRMLFKERLVHVANEDLQLPIQQELFFGTL